MNGEQIHHKWNTTAESHAICKVDIFKLLSFSHTLYLHHSFPACHSPQSLHPISPSLQINSSSGSLQTNKNKTNKTRAGLSRMSMEHSLTSYSKTGHKPSYQGWGWQPSRRNRVSSTGRDTAPHYHCWEYWKDTKLCNPKVHAGSDSKQCPCLSRQTL